jgi:hypothetical protein
VHETFPKLLGNISKTTWKFFQNYLETVHGFWDSVHSRLEIIYCKRAY